MKRISLSRVIIATLSISITVILWYFQVLTPTPIFPFVRYELLSNIYINQVYPNRIIIPLIYVLTIGAIVTIASGIRFFNKKLLKAYLRQIIQQQFADDITHFRISIYRIRYGLFCGIPYFLKQLRPANLISHKKKGILLYHLLNGPYNPIRQYAILYVRCGKPYPDGTCTFFTLAKENSDIDGFASHVLYEQKPLESELPDISGINLIDKYTLDSFKNRTEKHRITEYMAKGYISSFNKLKSIHRYCRVMWGTPISGSNEESWGVFIIDSTLSCGLTDDIETLRNSVLTIETILEN